MNLAAVLVDPPRLVRLYVAAGLDAIDDDILFVDDISVSA